eukprot:GHVU01125915.1.p1 GENE.GHVU01125915.1~~GHVU01125915.1.p1  ORF type:complete len:372 (-),score=22.42 GHVU01125915.1:484-1599(-)
MSTDAKALQVSPTALEQRLPHTVGEAPPAANAAPSSSTASPSGWDEAPASSSLEPRRDGCDGDAGKLSATPCSLASSGDEKFRGHRRTCDDQGSHLLAQEPRSSRFDSPSAHHQSLHRPDCGGSRSSQRHKHSLSCTYVYCSTTPPHSVRGSCLGSVEEKNRPSKLVSLTEGTGKGNRQSLYASLESIGSTEASQRVANAGASYVEYSALKNKQTRTGSNRDLRLGLQLGGDMAADVQQEASSTISPRLEPLQPSQRVRPQRFDFAYPRVELAVQNEDLGSHTLGETAANEAGSQGFGKSFENELQVVKIDDAASDVSDKGDGYYMPREFTKYLFISSFFLTIPTVVGFFLRCYIPASASLAVLLTSIIHW